MEAVSTKRKSGHFHSGDEQKKNTEEKSMEDIKDVIVCSVERIDMSDVEHPLIAVYRPNKRKHQTDYVARVFDGQYETNIIVTRNTLDELQQDIKDNMPSKMKGIYAERGKADVPNLIGIWV